MTTPDTEHDLPADLAERLARYGPVLDEAAAASTGALAHRGAPGRCPDHRRPDHRRLLPVAAAVVVLAGGVAVATVLGLGGGLGQTRLDTIDAGPDAPVNGQLAPGGIEGRLPDLTIAFNCIEEQDGATTEFPCFIQAGGGGLRRLPISVVPTFGPIPSPDRTSLAVMLRPATGGQNDVLRIVDPSSGATRGELTVPANSFEPTWTPAGDGLVYTADDTVYLTTVDRIGQPGATERFTGLPWPQLYRRPVVSPDGTHIAVTGGGADGTGGLAVIERATGEVRSVELGSYPSAAAWSPDGTRLAVAAGTGDNRSSLLVVDPATLAATVMAEADGPLYEPSWSPSADRLAVAGQHLLVADVAAAEARIVDPGRASVASLAPSWSADGRWLVVAALTNPAAPRSDLVLVDATTGTYHVITEGRADVGSAGGSYPAIW